MNVNRGNRQRSRKSRRKLTRDEHARQCVAKPDPTPDEIRERCEIIRRGWSAPESARRNIDHGGGVGRWSIPVVSVDGIDVTDLGR